MYPGRPIWLEEHCYVIQKGHPNGLTTRRLAQIDSKATGVRLSRFRERDPRQETNHRAGTKACGLVPGKRQKRITLLPLQCQWLSD